MAPEVDCCWRWCLASEVILPKWTALCRGRPTWTSPFSESATVEAYDPVTDTWSARTPMPSRITLRIGKYDLHDLTTLLSSGLQQFDCPCKCVDL
jgi:hypothetical protein